MKKQVREGRSLGIKEGDDEDGVNGRSYERDEVETEDTKGSRGEGAAKPTQERIRQREKQVDGERGEESDDRDEFGRREKPEAEIILSRCVNVINFKTYIVSVASG